MSQWQSRRHSHTLSAAAGTGPAPHSHRVTRRRSMSMANGNHMAAVVAAVQNAALGDPDAPSAASLSARRSVAAKAADGGTPTTNGSYSMAMDDTAPSSISHADDDMRDDVLPEEQSPFVLSRPASKSGAKARSRRASEGAHLRMHGGRRESGNELRCETCGKAYKHGSCLTKHLFVPLPPMLSRPSSFPFPAPAPAALLSSAFFRTALFSRVARTTGVSHVDSF